MSDMENVRKLPVLPVKNTVLFPNLLMPLSVGRPGSIAAVEAALLTEDKEIVVLAQRSNAAETPGADDLYTVGTKAVIKQMVRRQESLVDVLLLGVERVGVEGLDTSGPYLQASINPLPVPEEKTAEIEALHKEVAEMAAQALALAQPQAPADWGRVIANAEDPLRLVYFLASVLSLERDKEQNLLEAATCGSALRLMHTYLAHEVQVLELRSKIASQAESVMSKEQREYLLRQQMRAIQQELGGANGEQSEVELLRERLSKAELPEEAQKEAERELKRFERLPAGAPDLSIARTYLEFLLDLPWKKASDDVLDIGVARKVLDEDHYGLKEVKERILEHLAVLKLNPQAKAPILCFVGPPGVGKTSLGQSIARALGRKFERLSLGGLHDEAELRGHRRTYIGAMPGRIIQAIRRAGVNNPVLMLDEVDKIGHDFRGDPASALLEILDPEQNRTFRDNYLDLPFDLSKILFIANANTLDTVPGPLLDRMEVLRLSGYSEEEKLEIARRYLIARQLKECGLAEERLTITEPALRRIISRYTREAGVRQFERSLARVMRKLALRSTEGDGAPVIVGPDDLADLLGPERVSPEQARKHLPPGVVTGLAWTETGGDVLYVEAALLPNGRGLTLTGQLGAVMQESVKAAQSYIWAHARDLGIDPSMFRRYGLHVHVPAGAIPKDGPSAGVTMAVALTSAYTNCPAPAGIAMTGEVTLTGLVLPVGGIKEKMLAARRAGIRRVILPKANEKDLRELPDPVRKEMNFVLVETVEDALRAALPEVLEGLPVAKAS